MPLQARIPQQPGRHPGDEFRKAAFDAVANQFLSRLGCPELILDFRQRDGGLVSIQVFALGERPDQLRVARQRHGERRKFQGDLRFVAAGRCGRPHGNPAVKLGSIRQRDIHAQAFAVFVWLNFQIRVAKAGDELFSHLFQRLGLQIRQGDAVAEFFKGMDAVLDP